MRQKAARAVAIGAGRAAARINKFVDAKSEHVSFDASKHVLAVAGIKPASDASVNVDVSIRAGFIIDLREPGQSVKPGDVISGGAEQLKIIDAEREPDA